MPTLEDLIAFHSAGRAEAIVRMAQESTPRQIRERVGRAMMTRAEPGEMVATVSVRLMREALA